jgi:N-acetylglucosaminyl-diphospho-decaprenol L-rhamnosyltransferase
MTAPPPLVSVLIVNFNGRHLLGDCLEAVQRLLSVPYEIVLVDNASTDGSLEFVRSRFPNVRLVASSTNRGFTGGNNLAAAHARGEFLALLNSDTVLRTDLAPALTELDDPAVGAVGCRLSYGDGRLQPSFGYEHTPLRLVLSWIGLYRVRRLPRVFRRVEVDPARYAVRQPDVAWVSGACLLTRHALWRELGGLDERYFMYLEDVDFCRRLRARGQRIVYTPAAHVTHLEGGGKPWIGRDALLRTTGSYITYAEKFFGGPTVWAVRFWLATVFGARSLWYRAATLLAPSVIARDKSAAYRDAARMLVGRAPALRHQR